MARRSAQSVLKRAREQALREKRELKRAKKDARAEARRNPDGPAMTEETEETEDTDVTEAQASDGAPG
jgi:hypothetical protein